MTVRPDNRLADGAMQPVGCEACGAQVKVRKSSWEQTSVQWHADAVQACLERRAASPRPGPNGTTFSGCQALRDAIRAAAVRGEVPVQDDDPLPVNQETHDEVTHA